MDLYYGLFRYRMSNVREPGRVKRAVRGAALDATRMEALHDVAIAAGLGGTEQGLAATVVEKARVVASGSAAVLRWFEAASGGFHLIASTGMDGGVPGEIAGDLNTAIAEAFNDRKPVIDNDYGSSGRATQWGLHSGIRAQVAVPLLVDGKPVGTLVVLSFSRRTFDATDGLFLSLLAAIVAPALESARLARKVREGEESELKRLAEIIDAQRDIAGSEADVERLLTVLAERTVRLTGVGGVAVLAPQDDRLVVRALAGAPSDMTPGFTLPIEGSLAGLTYRTGEVQLVVDAFEDTRVHSVTARKDRIRSIVSVPIHAGERTMGVLQLMSGEPNAFDESDVRTTRMVAGFAGAAFERSISAARLRASERRTRAVIESAPYPIVIFDTGSGRIVDFNPAAEAQFGRSRADAVGMPVTTLLPERHVAAFQRWLSQGDRAGSAIYAGNHFETTAVHADGTEFPIEVAIADLPEETRLAAGFMRDLTLRYKLKESVEQLTAVISHAPVILFACDPTGTVTLSEGRGLATLGIRTEDIVGHRLQELLAGQPDALRHLERALRGEPFNGQIHLTQAGVEGGETVLEGTYGPIRDEHGELTGVSAILTNVTDRVRAEAAQRESEAKSRLMAIMNHEVRTPLNSILGFTQLLKQQRYGELNEVQRRYLGNVEESGKQLLELITDSLDLARLKSGHPAIKLENLVVRDVLERAADQVNPGATDRRLTVVVEPIEGIAVRADERFLTQVVLNLLSNAIRHTPAGGTVTLSAAKAADGVRLRVGDTGVGIPKEDMGRIFEEFFQAANHAGGGTGLGLTITRRLLEMMGGSIEAESELGKGSTFTVTLPAGQN